MHIDVKVSVWKRIQLPENVSKEQLIETLKLGEEGINDLFDQFDDLPYDEVENSEETLTPEDNGYQPTIELYDPEICGNGPIWTNAEHYYKSPEPEKPKYPETISLVWSVGDFEGKAQELEEVYPDEGDEYTDEKPMLYDRSKFSEALSLMERRHDCNYGVTWETVEYYLNEHCCL